jgi:hypothetical protein
MDVSMGISVWTSNAFVEDDDKCLLPAILSECIDSTSRNKYRFNNRDDPEMYAAFILDYLITQSAMLLMLSGSLMLEC